MMTSKHKLNFVFGKNSLVKLFFDNLINNIDEGSQVIVIDPKRTFSVGNLQRIHVFRPLDLQDFISITSELKNYQSSRLSTIIILDFPYFFRDFQGKAVKNVIINHRAFSACVSILEKISSDKVSIICGTYENPLSINFPLFHKIIKYYQYPFFKIMNLEDNFFKFRLEDGKTIKIKNQ